MRLEIQITRPGTEMNRITFESESRGSYNSTIEGCAKWMQQIGFSPDEWRVVDIDFDARPRPLNKYGYPQTTASTEVNARDDNESFSIQKIAAKVGVDEGGNPLQDGSANHYTRQIDEIVGAITVLTESIAKHAVAAYYGRATDEKARAVKVSHNNLRAALSRMFAHYNWTSRRVE